MAAKKKAPATKAKASKGKTKTPAKKGKAPAKKGKGKGVKLTAAQAAAEFKASNPRAKTKDVRKVLSAGGFNRDSYKG